MSKEHLLDLRKEIDEIDREILDLVIRRFETAIEIAKIKDLEGLPLYDPDREAAILRQLSVRLGENESIFEIVSVFESLLALSKKAQKKALEAELRKKTEI